MGREEQAAEDWFASTRIASPHKHILAYLRLFNGAILIVAYIDGASGEVAVAEAIHIVKSSAEERKLASSLFLSRVGFKHHVPRAGVFSCFVLSSVHSHL